MRIKFLAQGNYGSIIGAIIYCVSLLKPLADEEVYHNYAISIPDKRNRPGDNFKQQQRHSKIQGLYYNIFSLCFLSSHSVDAVLLLCLVSVKSRVCSWLTSTIVYIASTLFHKFFTMAQFDFFNKSSAYFWNHLSRFLLILSIW